MAGRFHDAGFLKRADLAALLANATVLVQPGGPTPFNLRRFPAKLAPYLASGTPVVMPACYCWIGVRNGQHAVMIDSGSASDIAQAIESVLVAPVLGLEMGRNAAAFAREKFDTDRCCTPLDAFYRSVLARPRSVRWQSIRRPRVELPLWLAANPERTDGKLRGALTSFASLESRRAPEKNTQADRAWEEGAPLVSVIVTNFNHRRFLPERFDSIFAQTYPNLEIIFLDDGSTDGSVDYVRSLESRFPLRIVANEKNSGSVLRQWHRGVVEARGDFVWIAESDDDCHPELIGRLMTVALRNPSIGLAYAQSMVVDEDGRRIESFLEYTDVIDRRRWRQDFVNSGREEAANYLVIRNTIPNASACLFRKSALLTARLESIPLRVCGDWLAYARICERHDIAFVSEHLNLHRRHRNTARARASRDGSIVGEMYAVQGFIRDHFDVPFAAQEAAYRASFRELVHVVKLESTSRTFADNSGLFQAASLLDPHLRERMAGRPAKGEPVLELRLAGDGVPAQVHSRTYDAWRWTPIRVGPCRSAAIVVPIRRQGLVALRRFRARHSQSGTLIWSAETSGDYRRIELDGTAQRVGSRDALEIFSWGDEPLLRLPIPKDLASGESFELEFEIRLSALPSYEPPARPNPTPFSKNALFVVPHLEMGGADRFNLDLVSQLTRRFDWEVTVVSTRASGDPWLREFRTLTNEIFMLHRFLAFDAYPAFFAYVIESRQPDVVYLSHSELGYRLLPWLKTAFPDLPVVDLVHIVADGWKDGGFPRLSCEARPWLARTVATSQAVRRWLNENGAKAETLEQVYTGIDSTLWSRSTRLTQIARERWRIPSDRPVILYAARFTEQKQPRLLPEIVAKLEALGWSFILLLAGDGPDREWLDEHLCRWHTHTVRMVGPARPDEMRLLMGASDLLILPSRSEGIALVLFEALSMGAVPVATDVGGNRELVTPDSGFIVPVDRRTADAIVESLDALMRDESLRERLAMCGRKRVEDQFRLDETGARMNAILRGVMQSREAPLAARAPPADMAATAGDLAKTGAEDAGSDEWNQRVGEGRWLPTLVSFSAGLLRRSFLRRGFRRLELRYGTRLGRWIAGRR
jgi:glycosyltransferase involved in cell wall biosynthesis